MAWDAQNCLDTGRLTEEEEDLARQVPEDDGRGRRRRLDALGPGLPAEHERARAAAEVAAAPGGEGAQLLQLGRLRRQEHHPELREADRHKGHAGLLLLQRGPAGQAAGRRHGLRRHRAERLHGRDHDQVRRRPEAGQVQDPQRQERRQGVRGPLLRPEQRVQPPLPVGHHGHPVQQEGDRPAPRSWDPMWDPRVRGQDRHAQRHQGDPRGRPLQAGILRERHGPGAVRRGRGRAEEAEAPAARLLRLDGEQARSSRTATSCSGTSSPATPSWRSRRTTTSTTSSRSPRRPAGRTTCASRTAPSTRRTPTSS